MSHRKLVPADLEGRTIVKADCRAENLLRLTFSDGTRLAIEVEQWTMVACDTCAAPKKQPR